MANSNKIKWQVVRINRRLHKKRRKAKNMNTYKVTASFWFFGTPDHTTIVKEYQAKNEIDARKLFFEDYPAMVGTGTIEKVEVL